MNEPNLLTFLQRLAADDPAQPLHARAFAKWIMATNIAEETSLPAIAREVAKLSGPERHPPHVAVLGYATAFDETFEAPFLDGLAWLSERKYFVAGRPRRFESDGLALMGVVVGLASLRLPRPDVNWLSDVLRNSLADAEANNDWNGSLISGAASVFGLATNSKPIPDLLAALHAKGLADTTREERAAAWSAAFDVRGSEDGMTRAATRIAAINYLSKDAPAIRFDRASVEDLGRVLHGLQRSLRLWPWESKPRTPRSATARWNVENEYHLQSLLWAVLAPVFPDIDDEEWLKSLGQHHPRGDFAIPSLRTIVEAKYMRPRMSFSEVIQQVAADCSTYLRDGSGFSHIIPVIWDDAARTQEHAELRRGLLALRGVGDAIVLSRPSFMTRTEIASDDSAVGSPA